jgi:DNA polymerase I-like protein with 3'-5' exonuclease and polymerase domains
MMKKLIIIGLVVAVIVAIGVYLYVFHKPARTAASEEAAYSVTTSSLLAEFEADENAANAKYLEKVIKVSGIVSSVTENDASIIVYLAEPESTSGVSCNFLKTDLDKSKITAGDKVFIKGICAGYLMDVMLNRCALDMGAAK